MTSMDFIVDLLHENLNCAETNNQKKLKKLWYQVMFLFFAKRKPWKQIYGLNFAKDVLQRLSPL